MSDIRFDDIPDTLLPLLRQVIGSHVEIIHYQIGNRHPDYLVVIARLNHPSIKISVKLAGPQAPWECPFDRTAAIYRLVAKQTTIPMPQLLAVDVSYTAWPWRYLIRTHIPGQEWYTLKRQMEAGELQQAYRQIGSAVAQIHCIRFPAFGEISPEGTVPGGSPFLAALQSRAKHSISNKDHLEIFSSVLERSQDLFSDVQWPVLCHEDLHGHNILFHQEKGAWCLATILDFDRAWAGHAEIDLARLDLWRGMTSPVLWRSYESVHPLEEMYKLRKPVYQLLWCLEYARNTQAHLIDTRQVCAQLGIPAIKSFGSA